MIAVLGKRWLSQGWRVMDEADSKPMALTFIELLNQHHIPYEHYEELWRRTVDLRARRLEQGMKCEDFSADLMIACWPSLKLEIRDRLIKEGKYLESNAPSDCDLCFGTGTEVVPGKGARPCKHGNVEVV